MLKCLAILAVLVLTTNALISAQAKPVEGTTKDNGARVTQPQSEIQRDDQDSKNSPSVIVQVGSQESSPPQASQKSDTDEKLARYTLWLAIFTAVLVGVSGVQGYFLSKQAGHLRAHAGHLDNLAEDSKTTSKAMAEMSTAISKQAEIMGKTMYLQFRPRLTIRGGFVDGTRTTNTKEVLGGRVEFVIINIGGTPAHIYKSQFVAKIVDYNIAGFSLFAGSTSIGEFSLQPGQGVTKEISFGLDALEEIRNQARKLGTANSTERPVYFVGSLSYRDDLNISRSLSVFRKFDPQQQSFIPIKDSDAESED
jgi:hypothetical protein